MRRNLTGKRILVTGCSSGIGRELCVQLCARGAHVLATARREERLVEVQRRVQRSERASRMGTLSYLAGDVCDPEFRGMLIRKIEADWGGLDVLVNNAGVGGVGLFETAPESRLRSIMDVDFFAAVELTRLALPLLKQGAQPAILNIGSVLSHRAVPMKSEYCAAKFALRGWSEALRVELMPEGVDVLMLSPSTTRSEFFDALIESDPKQKSASVGSMSPAQVAEAAIAVLIRSKRDLVLSLGGKFLVWAGKLAPRVTDHILLKFGMKAPTQ